LKLKFIKFIATLLLFLIPFVSSAKAADNLPPTSIDQSEEDKLCAISLHELQSAALPMQPGCIDQFVLNNDVIKRMKNFSLLPHDGNIYYFQYTQNSITYTNYFKFLYVTLGDFPYVVYHVYYWNYSNYNFVNSGVSQDEEELSNLYNQIKSGNNTSDTPYDVTRYSTNTDIANAYNSAMVDNVVIATDSTFADSLSGAVLAASLKAPILFVNGLSDDSAYTYVNNHLSKIGSIYILGKEGAVSTSIENNFKNSGFNVVRLGGSDRFDTCKLINDKLSEPIGSPVIVVNGENFADAISISSVAAMKHYPVLLVKNDSIPDQTIEQLKYMQPLKIYAIGGTGVISDNVLNKLKSFSNTVTRIYGSDRYETSLNVCKYFNIDGNKIVLSTGAEFKDALAGSVLAAKLSAPLLLVSSDISKQKQYLDSSKYRNLIILGNTDSISNDAINGLEK
jgi:putative cell wall-binding protein